MGAERTWGGAEHVNVQRACAAGRGLQHGGYGDESAQAVLAFAPLSVAHTREENRESLRNTQTNCTYFLPVEANTAAAAAAAAIAAAATTTAIAAAATA